MTRKTYVKFEAASPIWKRPAIDVKTLSGDLLGSIEWYPRWRQYVFEPLDAVFSVDCLQDIAAQVLEMNKGR